MITRKHHFSFTLFIFLITLIGFSNPTFAQEEEKKKGKLERFKDRDKEEKDDDEDTDDSDCDGCSFFLSDVFIDISFEVLKAIFSRDPSDPTRFSAYPYAQGEEEFATRNANGERTGFGQIKTYYQWIDSEDSDINALGFSARGRIYSRVGINIDYTQYTETWPDGETEQLNVFRLGIIKSVVINEQLVLDLDFALRNIDEDGGGEIGLRSQIFPGKPYMLDLFGSVGSVDGDTFGELNVGVGYIRNRVQLDFGFRSLLWSGRNLTGAQIGFRIWF